MNAQVTDKAKKVFGLVLVCMAMVACAKQEAQTPVAVEPAPATAAAEDFQEPAHALLIVLPEKTPPADLPQKLAAWKASGAVSSAVLTKQFSHEAKPGYSLGFENLAVLDFTSESAFDSWKIGSAAELGPDVIVSRVDVLLDRRSEKNDPAQSIFVVGIYESLVSKDEYQDFTDAYIEPNMANQYFSGIMTRYTMYLEREATGAEPEPKAFLVTEYANKAEYDRKASVKNPYKALLLSGTHPEWARINETKKGIRRDYSETYANSVNF